MEKDIIMIENKTNLHHIVHVGDGKNYKRSLHPFWGLSQNARSYIRNFINVGDVLWFCQDFQDGLKVIGMAEYIHCYDIHDEPLIPMNIIEREKQNWDMNMDNDIQIHYKNIYNTERQNIVIEKTTEEISTYSNDYGGDLYRHYGGFKFYGKPL